MRADDELEKEQRHLDRARAQLRRMREATEALEASKASDAVSAEALQWALARRVAALQDDPRTTLFFGRLDTADEVFHIGRRHVTDEMHDPVVLDWRAPVATAFYRASPTDPMGVVRRRRFGVNRGRLTAYEDELLTRPEPSGHEPSRHEPSGHEPSGHEPSGDAQAGRSASAILAEEIERPRSGPMRDIVATIQPEQDEVVRSGLATSVCVQGAPGTGKTAVGLHRAAWLLYTHRARLERSGVLVVGPNRAFIDHIAAVLPSLGEAQVSHSTALDLVAQTAVRSVDPTHVAVLKGDEVLAPVLRRAVWSRVARATEPLVVPRGASVWRLPAYEVQELLDELVARGVRYEIARALLPQRLAHRLVAAMERAGTIPAERTEETLARNAVVRRYANTLWPALDPASVLFSLWSDRDALAAAAGADLTDAQLDSLVWDRAPRSVRAARWSEQDLVLIDELADLIDRRPTVGHLVLDEAQDLSPMQLRAVGRRAAGGSVTVLGDLAQGTTPWSTPSWSQAMTHLGQDSFELVELTRGFRVPAAVIELAARLLPHIAADLAPPESVRANPGVLSLHPVRAGTSAAATAGVLAGWDAMPGSVGVIVSDAAVPALARELAALGVEFGELAGDHGDLQDHRVQLVPATVAKGLEFDRVVVVEPAAIAAAEPDERTGLRRLYVVLTRAVSELAIVHEQPLPEPLR